MEEKINKAVEDKQLIIRYIEEIQQKRESLDKIIAGWQTDKHELELKLAKMKSRWKGIKKSCGTIMRFLFAGHGFQNRDFVMSSAMRKVAKSEIV